MKNHIIQSFRTLTFIILGFGMLLLLYNLLYQQQGIGMSDDVKQIAITGSASIDGKPYEEITENLWQDEIRRTLVVMGSFDHNIDNGNSLILWPRNLRIKLYVNGILKLSAGQRESFPDFIQYAGNSYQIFYIGTVSKNDVIRLDIEKAYETCRINVLTEFFQNIYIGREGDVYHSIITNELIHPLIGTILILIGILVLTSSLLQKYTQFQHMRQISFLGWFNIIGGLAYINDSAYEFIDLLFPYPVFNTLVDLCCIPALILFYLMYINSVLTSRPAKIFMRLVTVIYILLEMIPILLQFNGILDLHVIQDQFVYMGGIIILCSLWAISYEIIVFHNPDMRKVLIISLPLMLGLLFKIVNVIFERGIERSYLRIGILFSCLLLLNDTSKFIRRSLELIEQEKQMKEEIKNAHISIMLSQIQPHFLYNALNTLGHICKKDGDLAAEAIDHFSRYLRGNMDSLTTDRPIPFNKELEHVQHYLYIEHLRFGDRVQVEYDLECTDFSLPTLTLQPIVENAIRHGITKQAKGGVVKISTRRINDEIQIIISDNGIGFNQMNLDPNDRRHVGMSNVKKRIKLQCNGTIDIISNEGIGTQVTIRMKGDGSALYESHGCRR